MKTLVYDNYLADIYDTKIYVVKAGDWVKVGRSKGVAGRMRSLQCGCPLRLELVMVRNEVQPFTEARIHDHLKRRGLHHFGEWFRYCDETLDVIEVHLGAPTRWHPGVPFHMREELAEWLPQEEKTEWTYKQK